MSRTYPAFPSAEVVAIGFALVVAAAAAGLSLWIGKDWLLWWDARGWTPARCTVVSVGDDAEGPQYAYERDGVRYVSGRIAIGQDRPASVWAAGIQIGATVECWVDPDDPSRSLIDRDLEGVWLLPGAWLLAAFLLLAALRGIGVILRWLLYRPVPPLTWGEWRESFYRQGAWKMSGVGGALLVFGGVLTWTVGAVPFWNWRDAQTWTAATCVVIEGEVRWSAPRRFPLRGGYVMDIAFAYQAYGRQYVAATYSPWRAGIVDWLLPPPRDVEKGRVIERTESFALGTTHRCYFSPDNPARAYIERGWWDGWYAFAAIGPGFILFGLIVVMARPRA